MISPQSEGNIRALLEMIPVGMSFSRDGVCIGANRIFLRMFGYEDVEEIRGKPLLVLIAPPCRDDIEERIQRRIAETPTENDYETVGLRKDGSQFPVRISSNRDFQSDGPLTFSCFSDLSDRNQAEAILRDSEKKFHLIFDAANDGIAILALDGHLLDVNRNFHERLGYRKEEMVGRPVADFDSPEFADKVPDRMSVLAQAGQVKFESANMRTDGYVLPIEIHARIIELNGQRVCLSVARDISERKQSDLAVQRENQKNKLLLRMANDGLHILDREGKLQFMSDAFCNMLGYTREEMLGMHVSTWDAHFSRDELMARIPALIKQGNTFETVHRRKDGSLIDVEIIASPINLDGEEMLYNSSRDITERKLNAEILRVSEERLRLSLNAARQSWFDLNVQTNDVLIDPEYIRMLGYGPAEFHPSMNSWIDNLHPDDSAGVLAAFQTCLATGGPITIEYRRRNKAGDWIWISSIGKIEEWDAEGRPLRMMGVHTDITRRKLAEIALQENEQLWSLALEGGGDCVWDWNLDSGEVHLSKSGKAMFGFADNEIGNRISDWQDLVHPEDAAQVSEALLSLFHDEVEKVSAEYRLRCKDGSWKWVLTRGLAAERGADGRVRRMIGTHTDLTERKLAEQTIIRHANYDALTQLPNRRLFRDRLEQESKKSLRTGLTMALLLIDLDNFKEVNDTLGHDMGDILLVEAARRITECVRDSDTVARLGGDEFTVILAELNDTLSIDRVSQEILDKLFLPFQLGEEQVFISASVGITLYPADSENLEILLKYADQAMYLAKNQGRNRFVYYTAELQEDAQNRMRLIGDLRVALGNNQFVVYYQPIVDLATGMVNKAEALLRWQHPVLGLVYPSEFISLAEETGMIVEIGNWVFKQAVKQAKSWREMCHRECQISVNKSPVQFNHDADHPHDWPDYIQQMGLPGQSVAIEITEGVLLNIESSAKEKLLAFRDAGIQVAIDGFGTGYSSLAYLKKFDIDYIKIDQSFISNLQEDSEDMALCEAIIVMAHKLGLKVIAEGVETAEQSNLLLRAGCDYAQGFYFSMPLPAEAFEKLPAVSCS